MGTEENNSKTEERSAAELIWPHLPTEGEGQGNPAKKESPDTVVYDDTIVAEPGKPLRTTFREGAPNLDFSTISDFEGRSVTGEVPIDDSTGKPIDKSGTTVATGVDLGQMNERDLKRYGLLPGTPLHEKLTPYLGLKGYDAIAALEKNRLVLTEEEAAFLDKSVHTAKLRALAKNFDTSPDNSTGKKFHELPPAAQTVIYSVATQYGTNLKEKTPKFWGHVTNGRSLEAYKELLDFKDKYPTRRRSEAHYLNRGLSGGDE